MTAVAAPGGGPAPGLGADRGTWTDPRYLRSHFGGMLHGLGETALAGIGHGEADEVAKDLVIARRGAAEWRLFRLIEAPDGVPSRAALIERLADATRRCWLDGVEVTALPGADRFALSRGGHYLSVDHRGKFGFVASRALAWESFEGIRPGPLAYQLWRPARTMGGTQLMEAGLASRLGDELGAINLMLHRPDRAKLDGRPLVIWLHNDAHDGFAWCAEPALVALVDAFVFVSAWQRDRFRARFALPADRCHVIRNATDACPDRLAPERRPWRLRCAYTSAPNRGLAILLDAWERLDPADAELHVWSSFRLWGRRFHDGGFHPLFDRARRMPGVTYHGVRPNHEIRAALREMHFLTYPCTVAETSCLAVLEAMAAGVRVITTTAGALSETTAGFARLYDAPAEGDAHRDRFTEILGGELAASWDGRAALSRATQNYVRQAHGWDLYISVWRRLIERLVDEKRRGLAPSDRHSMA